MPRSIAIHTGIQQIRRLKRGRGNRKQTEDELYVGVPL